MKSPFCTTILSCSSIRHLVSVSISAPGTTNYLFMCGGPWTIPYLPKVLNIGWVGAGAKVQNMGGGEVKLFAGCKLIEECPHPYPSNQCQIITFLILKTDNI